MTGETIPACIVAGKIRTKHCLNVEIKKQLSKEEHFTDVGAATNFVKTMI